MSGKRARRGGCTLRTVSQLSDCYTSVMLLYFCYATDRQHDITSYTQKDEYFPAQSIVINL